MEDDRQNPYLWQYDEEDFDLSTPVAIDLQGDGNSDSQPQEQSRETSVFTEPALRAACPPYTIKWALCTKKKRLHTLATDTIQGIDVYPSRFWRLELKSLINKAVVSESLNETHVPSKTQVNFSITERGVGRIELYFQQHSVAWDKLDKQIKEWADLVSTRGRALVLKIFFIFKEATPIEEPNRAPRRGGPATNRQFAKRTRLLNDPETASSYTTWEAVVSIFECPGQCNIGPYCWEDPEDKKRYPVDNTILEDLVEMVMNGLNFEKHEDMPTPLADRVRKGFKVAKKRKDNSAIHITNVMPGGTSLPAKRAKIPGTYEGAIRSYRNRLVSHTNDAKRIRAIDSIAAFIDEQLFDLNDFAEKHIEFFTKKFPLGLATQWVMGVDRWRKELTEEQQGVEKAAEIST